MWLSVIRLLFQQEPFSCSLEQRFNVGATEAAMIRRRANTRKNPLVGVAPDRIRTEVRDPCRFGDSYEFVTILSMRNIHGFIMHT